MVDFAVVIKKKDRKEVFGIVYRGLNGSNISNIDTILYSHYIKISNVIINNITKISGVYQNLIIKNIIIPI